jgi:hypothetical protein
MSKFIDTQSSCQEKSTLCRENETSMESAATAANCWLGV